MIVDSFYPRVVTCTFFYFINNYYFLNRVVFFGVIFFSIISNDKVLSYC